MKKFFIALAVIGASLASQAAYLYWQVDQSDYDNIVNYMEVDTAYLYAKAGDDSATKIAALKTNNTQDYYTVDVSNYTGYSFYVELINYDSKSVLGYSQTVSYTALASNNSIIESDTPLSISQVSVWHGVAVNHESGGGGGFPGGGYNAPEPTSAMLLLIGFAGIALKRKQI